MNSMKCPHCADGTMKEHVYEKSVKAGRKCVVVAGLKRFACDSCAGELVSRAQMKENNRLIAEATDRDAVGTVDAAVLKRLRETFELTQRDASLLFGAGESSFGKWESGQTAMSTPAALLVRCAVEIPGVVEHLARLRGYVLPHRPAPVPPYEASVESELHWEAISLAVAVTHNESMTAFSVECTGTFDAMREMMSKFEPCADELDDENEWIPGNLITHGHAIQPGSIARIGH